MEGFPGAPETAGATPVPPPPTVTGTGLDGIDNFVPPGKDVLKPPAPPPPPDLFAPAPPPATTK
jgi:hypothetical protein